MEKANFQIFWHFDCVQKNPKGSFYELRKGLLHAMCSRIKIKAFLVPKCIKGEKTLKLCRSLLNHFGLRSFLNKHSRFVLFVCLWLLKATRLLFRQTVREHVPDWLWYLKDSSLDPGAYAYWVQIAKQFWYAHVQQLCHVDVQTELAHYL